MSNVNFYRERDALNGGTNSPWSESSPFGQWADASDFQDDDADDSGDVVDAYKARTTSGALSLSELAPVASYKQ